MFNFVLKHKEKFLKVLNSSSHAILLESSDDTLLKNITKVYAMNLFCKTQNACGICSSCLKIMDNNNLDVIIYPTQKNFLMDDVKDLLEKLNITPAENDYKIFIINNIDSASPIVQNKLLKSIEEPPKFVKFVLTCSSKQKVLPTIVSRCEVIPLSKFTPQEMQPLLENLPSEYKQILGEFSEGNLSILEKLKDSNDFIENYNFAIKILCDLTNSKQMLNFSSVLNENKQKFMEIIEIFDKLLFDVIKINNGQTALIINKYCLDKLVKASKSISTLACLNIKNNIVSLSDKLKLNANLNGVVDEFLLKYLEEKWKNKKL